MSRVQIGGSFELTDHKGNHVTAETYRGRHMVIFFGFTHCRKVCPETLGKLSRALDALGDEAGRFAPLYITVDPERDDPQTMRAFLEQDYPRFTGLTGSPDAIARAKTAYKVYAAKAPDEEDPAGYSVPHSALVFLTDADGRYVTHVNDGAPVEAIVDKLRFVLAQ